MSTKSSLTPKQIAAIKAAAPAQRPALQARFEAQRATAPRPAAPASKAKSQRLRAAVKSASSPLPASAPPQQLRELASLRREVLALKLRDARANMRAALLTNRYMYEYSRRGCPRGWPVPRPHITSSVTGYSRYLVVHARTTTASSVVAAHASGMNCLIAVRPYALRYPLRAYRRSVDGAVTDAGCYPAQALVTTPDDLHQDDARLLATTARDRLLSTAAGSMAAVNVAFEDDRSPLIDLASPNVYQQVVVNDYASGTASDYRSKATGVGAYTNGEPVMAQVVGGYICLEVTTTLNGVAEVYCVNGAVNHDTHGYGAGRSFAENDPAGVATHQHGLQRILANRHIRLHDSDGTSLANHAMSSVRPEIVPGNQTRKFLLPLTPDRCFFNVGDIDPADESTGSSNYASTRGYFPHNISACVPNGVILIKNTSTTENVSYRVWAHFVYAAVPPLERTNSSLVAALVGASAHVADGAAADPITQPVTSSVTPPPSRSAVLPNDGALEKAAEHPVETGAEVGAGAVNGAMLATKLSQRGVLGTIEDGASAARSTAASVGEGATAAGRFLRTLVSGAETVGEVAGEGVGMAAAAA